VGWWLPALHNAGLYPDVHAVLPSPCDMPPLLSVNCYTPDARPWRP
jgi:hypothetical protein